MSFEITKSEANEQNVLIDVAYTYDDIKDMSIKFPMTITEPTITIPQVIEQVNLIASKRAERNALAVELAKKLFGLKVDGNGMTEATV
jgi:hypothetical protein